MCWVPKPLGLEVDTAVNVIMFVDTCGGICVLRLQDCLNGAITVS